MKKILILLLLLLECNAVYSIPHVFAMRKAKAYYKQALREHEKEMDSIAYYTTLNSLNIQESIGKTNTPFYAECLHTAGILALQGLGSIDLFNSYFERTIQLKNELGRYSDYYWSLECYANGYLYIVDNIVFLQKIELLEFAIDIYKQIPQYSAIEGYRKAINKLAVLYADVNVNTSIDLCEQLLVEQRELHDVDSLVTLSNLANFYTDIDNEKALKYANIVLETRIQSKPIDYDGIRIAHLRIASIYGHSGEYENAIMHSEEARKIAKELYGAESEQYARSTQNSGVYTLLKGDTLGSLNYFKEAYRIPKGDKHEIASNLGGLYNMLGENDSCYLYTKEAWDLYRNDFLQNLQYLTIENRYTYATVEKNFGLITSPLNLYMISNQLDGYTEYERLVYDCMIFIKNIVLDCMGNENALDILLLQNADSIKSYLSDNEVVIDFWFNKEEIIPEGGDVIVSILRKEYENPILIKLSADKICKTLMNEYETTEEYLPLYENIWKEVVEKAKLKRGETIYLSLDDILYDIPVEYILDYEWEYMGDKYNIIRVSSTLNIPLIKRNINITDAILYGGLTYEYETTSTNYEDIKYAERTANNLLMEIDDSVLYALRSSSDYLPWTKLECDSINKILVDSLNENVRVYQFENGTEKSFKSLSGNSPSLIHVATHGFCLTPDSAENLYEYYAYCMDHSGLLMSGVLSSKKNCGDSLDIEDGFLTSSEIATLDLSNTELLVLSACKTGELGLTYLGLAGLQKAFKAAGVKSMLLTLDDVDDTASFLLMVSFYKYLMNGYSRRESLRKAQQILRESDRFRDFRYWGSFVLID